MMKAVAIDDEPVALTVIRQLCVDVPYVGLTGTFTDPRKAMEYMEAQQTDLLFLDINMPGMSGIEFLQRLKNRPVTIFTTAHSEHALRGFELEVTDYLLKPFSQERFKQACDRAKTLFDMRSAIQQNEEHVFIRTGYERVKVTVSEIMYVQSAGNYVHFVLRDRKIISRLTMAQAEALLPAAAFIRIHRSYIAARNHIQQIEKTRIVCGGAVLPLAPGHTLAGLPG